MTDEGPHTAAHSISTSVYLAAVASLMLVVCLPIALMDNVPFVDYPNHLARYYILQNIENSAVLQQYYTVKDGLYPYWAMRLVLNTLSYVTGIESAGKIFVALAGLMPIAGGIAVSRVIFGRASLLPLTAFAFYNNLPMALGFQNYLFASGLAMISFALWLACDRWPSLVRTSVFAAITLLLALLHLLSAVVLVALLIAWQLATLNYDHNWLSRLSSCIAETAAIFCPAIVLAVALRDENIGLSATIDGGLPARIAGIASALWSGQNSFELLIGFWLLGGIGAALWLGMIKMPKRCFWFLIILGAITLAAPFSLFGVTYINTRLPLLLIVLVLACCKADYANFSVAKLNVAGAIFLTLGIIKFSLATFDAAKSSQQITEARRSFAHLPAGARIFTAIETPAGVGGSGAFEGVHQQLVSYAVIDRQAFVPRLFTMYEIGLNEELAPTGRSVSYPVDIRLLGQPFSTWPDETQKPLGYAQDWRDDYDYLLLIDFGATAKPLDGTERVHEGSYFEILKVVPASGS